MSRRFIVVLCVVAAVGLILVLCGCSSVPAPITHHTTPSAPLVASQEAKDSTVLSSAATIDSAVAGTPAQPAVNAATNDQRAAVASAPASAVKAILGEKDAAIGALTKENGTLRENLAKAEDKFSTALRWFLTGGGALIMALGVGSFFLMGQITAIFPNLGPRIFIGIVAFGATLFASGIAYAWAASHQTIVGCALGASALAALVYWHANRVHASIPTQPDNTTKV